MVQGYYTIQEAAHYLSISVEELRQMAQKGQIRSFQDRGTLRFRIQDIQELARQRGGSSDPELALGEPVPLAPKSSAAPSSGKRKSQHSPKTPAKKQEVPDVFDFEFDNENVDLSGDFLGPPSSPKSGKSGMSAKGGGGKKPPSSTVPQAGSDSDVRLVSDGSDVSFSIGKDSDIKLADSQVKPQDPTKPKSGSQASSGSKKSSQLALGSSVQPPKKSKTSMSPKPGSSRPASGAQPVDSGVRLVPMDSDSDVKILGASDEVPLGEHMPAHTDSNVRLDRVQMPPADSGEGNMMLTEEINLDEEIRKLEERDKENPATKMKAKSELKFPTTSPFELSDSDMKMPSELMEDSGPKTPVKQTSDDSDSSDFDIATQPHDDSSDFDLGAQPTDDGNSDFDLPSSGDASADDSDFSLELPADEQEQVLLDETQGSELSEASGISLGNPVDAGISLEDPPADEGSDFDLSLDIDDAPRLSEEDDAALSDADSDFQLQAGDTPNRVESRPATDESDSEFELSLDSESQGSQDEQEVDFSLEADASEEQPAASQSTDDSEFELNISGDEELENKPDSDSEFELTLDDSGNIASLEVEEEEAPQVKSKPKPKPKKGKSKAAPASDAEQDIFETDFEVPALDESDENTVADSELESSDFDLDLDDSVLDNEEESGSQVIALDEEEMVVDGDEEAVADDVEVEEESSDFADINEDVEGGGGKEETDTDEEEETETKSKGKVETIVKPKLVPAAPWGVVPVLFMLPCVVVMFLVGILGYELMQSSAGLRPPGALTVTVAEWIGQPIVMKR